MQVVAAEPCVALALRPRVGHWLCVRICSNTLHVDDMTISQYLAFKEKLANGGACYSTLSCGGKALKLFVVSPASSL